MKLSPEYIKQVTPKRKNVSDKYSWNLYMFIQKNPYLKVYKIGWNIIDGVCPVDEGMTVFCDGYDNSARLWGVLNGSQKEMHCCLSWSGTHWNNLEKEDITDKFWRDYLRIGACSFGRDHYHEFVSINRNSRKCKYCDTVFYRKIETVKKIDRVERWVR